VLNLAVSGRWPGSRDHDLPQVMLVDDVRVYRRQQAAEERRVNLQPGLAGLPVWAACPERPSRLGTCVR
jgi:hypothetical protein